jgi:hypothetical protein
MYALICKLARIQIRSPLLFSSSRNYQVRVPSIAEGQGRSISICDILILLPALFSGPDAPRLHRI